MVLDVIRICVLHQVWPLFGSILVLRILPSQALSIFCEVIFICSYYTTGFNTAILVLHSWVTCNVRFSPVQEALSLRSGFAWRHTLILFWDLHGNISWSFVGCLNVNSTDWHLIAVRDEGQLVAHPQNQTNQFFFVKLHMWIPAQQLSRVLYGSLRNCGAQRGTTAETYVTEWTSL